MDYCDECASDGCRGHELCDDCTGDICDDCGGCDCPDNTCPGWIAHQTGND